MIRPYLVTAIASLAAGIGVPAAAAAGSPPVNPAIAVYVEQLPTATGSQVTAPLGRSARPSSELAAKAGSDAAALAALAAASPSKSSASSSEPAASPSKPPASSSRPSARTGSRQQPSATSPRPRIGAVPVRSVPGAGNARLVVVAILLGLGAVGALALRLGPGRLGDFRPRADS